MSTVSASPVLRWQCGRCHTFLKTEPGAEWVACSNPECLTANRIPRDRAA
jgi:LSD1 subclass zinc finger protein